MTQETASKFTPGPWREKENSLRVLAQDRNEDGEFEPLCVADCGQSLHLSDYLAQGEREANARLIAKAPEMYELLETVESYYHDAPQLHPHDWDTIVNLARRIKAAIDGEG